MVNPKVLRVLGSAFCFYVNKFHKVKGITGLLPVFSVDCVIWNFFLMVNILKRVKHLYCFFTIFNTYFYDVYLIAASRIVMSIYILILYNSKL